MCLHPSFSLSEHPALLTPISLSFLQVSALKQGLMPLSQESLLIGDVSYHEYQGIFVNQEEKDKLARNLGPINKVCSEEMKGKERYCGFVWRNKRGVFVLVLMQVFYV